MPFTSLSYLPTEMKRGFLNSKKAKGNPLDADSAPSAASTATAPQKQSLPLVDGTTAYPKTPSGPIVGRQIGPRVLAKNVEPYAVVRFPSVRVTKSKEPSSTCIFRPSTCLKVMSTPGFYTRMPPRDPTDFVFTKNTPSMGVGLFAKRHLKSGHIIFWERPLLIMPMGMGIPFSEGLSEEDVIKLHDAKFEDTLRQTLKVMPKEDVDAYMKLSNCLPTSPPLVGIAGTNAFGTGTELEEGSLLEGNIPYGVIAKIASRINHSCTANVQTKFDIPKFAFHVIAKRDIKAGEQLFYSYCEEDKPVQERRRQLATYGFVCQCSACVAESMTVE